MLVGIPRCLGYYYLSSLYRTFLDSMKVPWIESPASTSSDLESLNLCPTDEPCVSVKAAFGHAKRLLDRGADVLFVPKLISLSNTGYCCPKMMALPDMLRAGLGLKPERIVSPCIDMKDSPKKWRSSWIKAAKALGQRDAQTVLSEKVDTILDRGIAAWEAAEDKVLYGMGTRPDESIPTIGVMGHAYVLHDVFGSKILETVGKYGRVVTAETVSFREALKRLDRVPDGQKLWAIESRILGAALEILSRRAVDRLVFVQAFSCGPASIIENYIMHEAEDRGVPVLSLTVDEHSGEAGLITRLEAFLDAVGNRRYRTRASRMGHPPGGQAVSVSRPMMQPSRPPHIQSNAPTAFSGQRPPLGFVSMGNLDIALSAIFRDLSVPFVKPPPLSEKVVNLGKELAPEFICHPMVTLLGQMRYLADRGIDRIMMVQGKGRCRLGWYAQVMESLLNRAGYKVQVLTLDSPFPWREKGVKFLEDCRNLAGPVPVTGLLRAAQMGFSKQALADRGAEVLREVRATESVRGQGDRIYEGFLRELDSAGTIRESLSVYRKYAVKMRQVPRDHVQPIKLGLVGEIYVVNEPYVNRDAEKILGSFDTRVRVIRRLDVSGWVSYHLFKTPRALWDYHRVVSAAEPYLSVSVGGHGQESVGETVLSQKHEVEGVLHLFPFTCMPEIIAQNILVRVSSDLDIPVLSIMLSEQTGVAGLKTRLEAFVDLLAGRRKRGVNNFA